MSESSRAVRRPMRHPIAVWTVLTVVALGVGCGSESEADDADVRGDVSTSADAGDDTTPDVAEGTDSQSMGSFIAAVEGLCTETIARRRAVPEVATPEGTEALNKAITEINEEMLDEVRELPQPERAADAALAAELYEGRARSTDLWGAYEYAAQVGDIERAEAIYNQIEGAEAEVEKLLEALGLSDRCFVG